MSIVNHQARERLRDCLLSLERHPYTLGPMEIVVLDNASEDGSIEMLREDFPEVIVVAENTRRGFGANQNRAIRVARGRLVFMLNPDAVVGASTLDALAESMGRDERVAAVGCRVLNSDGTVRQSEPYRFPAPLGIFAKAIGLGRFFWDRGTLGDVFRDGWMSGGAMLIDRQAFLDVGGFDESFFMYSEDVDLCRRLRGVGYLFAWDRTVSVIHPLPKESHATLHRRQREIAKAELLYFGKHYSTFGQGAYRLGAILDGGLRVIALAIPGVSRLIRAHGLNPSEAWALRRARLRAVLHPTRGDDLRQLANTWNSNRS